LFKASGALWTLDEDRTLIPRAWTGQDLAGERLAPGEGFAGRAIGERRGLITNDYARSPHAAPRFVAAGVRSVIVQPVILRDRPLGVLTMSRAGVEAAPFGAEDLALLQSFAAHASTALANARLYEEATRYAQRLRALEEVNRLVSSSLNPDEVLANLARAISQFFDAPYVSVWGLDETTGRLRRTLTHGDPALAAELHDTLAPGEGGIGWVVQRREPIFWTEVARDARAARGGGDPELHARRAPAPQAPSHQGGRGVRRGPLLDRALGGRPRRPPHVAVRRRTEDAGHVGPVPQRDQPAAARGADQRARDRDAPACDRGGRERRLAHAARLGGGLRPQVVRGGADAPAGRGHRRGHARLLRARATVRAVAGGPRHRRGRPDRPRAGEHAALRGGAGAAARDHHAARGGTRALAAGRRGRRDAAGRGRGRARLRRRHGGRVPARRAQGAA